VKWLLNAHDESGRQLALLSDEISYRSAAVVLRAVNVAEKRLK